MYHVSCAIVLDNYADVKVCFQQIGNAKGSPSTWNSERKTLLATPVALWRMRCFQYSKHISSVMLEHGVFQAIRTIRKPFAKVDGS